MIYVDTRMALYIETYVGIYVRKGHISTHMYNGIYVYPQNIYFNNIYLEYILKYIWIYLIIMYPGCRSWHFLKHIIKIYITKYSVTYKYLQITPDNFGSQCLYSGIYSLIELFKMIFGAQQCLIYIFRWKYTNFK